MLGLQCPTTLHHSKDQDRSVHSPNYICCLFPITFDSSEINNLSISALKTSNYSISTAPWVREFQGFTILCGKLIPHHLTLKWVFLNPQNLNCFRITSHFSEDQWGHVTLRGELSFDIKVLSKCHDGRIAFPSKWDCLTFNLLSLPFQVTFQEHIHAMKTYLTACIKFPNIWSQRIHAWFRLNVRSCLL